MDFWLAIVAIVVSSLILRAFLGSQQNRLKQLQLEARNKELDIERMKQETKLLEAKGPELPSWLDQSNPEEVRRYREAHAEVGSLQPNDAPKRAT
jgi:phage terminase small subunit